MRVVVRADGGAALGMGHVMRCLALAERLGERGAAVTFLTREEPAALARIAAHGCEVVALPPREDGAADVAAVLERAAASGARAAVVDLQGFPGEAQARIRAAGLRLTVLDDMGGRGFEADVVLNPNVDARRDAYAVAPHTRLLLGPRYALLRRAFVERAAAPPAAGARLLITMGGGDADNGTLRALQEADGLDAHVTLDVLLGAAFPHGETVETAARRARHPVRIHPDPRDPAALMAAATVALSAAGTTCLELAHLGVPAVLLVLADNQAGNAAGLARAGCAVSLGDAGRLSGPALREKLGALLSDPERRARMGALGRELVDGAGAARVAAEVLAA
jgi:UDP-2,4-diacetamido-2,4,6-trideoxy-beta-L-altropyranose hydrolase